LRGLSTDDVEAFVELFDSSDWKQLDLVVGEFELHLSKNAAPIAVGVAPAAPRREVSAPPEVLASPAVGQSSSAAPVAEQGSAAVAAVPPPMPSDSAGMLEVRAPHLGTFYRAPKPGSAPYVEVGQSIQADSEVCLLEVMKLFTTMRAGVCGVIRKVCVTDSTLVESGQVLFLVEPLKP